MNFYRSQFIHNLLAKHILRHRRRRLFLTKLFIKDRDLDIQLLGSRMRINSISEIGYLNAFWNQTSSMVFRDELPSILNIALILEAGDAFVDAGANVGLYSGLLGRLTHVHAGVEFWAFEANRETAQRLTETVKGLAVAVRSVALSNSEGVLKFTSGASSAVFSCVPMPAHESVPGSVTEVPARRLDSFPIASNSIVLKIDVEAHELEVLQGAEAFFVAGRVKAVYLDGYSDTRIPDLLAGRGFELFDGRTLIKPPQQGFSVLALHRSYLERANFKPTFPVVNA